MKFNISTFVIALISLVAVMMAGLMLLLLPRSGEIIHLMQWRMVRVKSFHVEVAIRYAGWNEYRDENYALQKDREKIRIDTRGWVDRGGVGVEDTIMASQEFRIVLGEEPDMVDLRGEYLKFGDTDFVRFGRLPARVGVVELDEYADQWLRFSLSELRKKLDTPLFGSGGRELDALDVAYLLDQFRQTPFLNFERKLKGEELFGVPVNHYSVTPEILFFKDYFVRAESMRLGRELTSAERLAVDTFFANVTAGGGELWIGKRDYYLYRIRLRFIYDDGARRGTFDVTVSFSRFNDEVSIEGPGDDVREIGPILHSLLPSVAEHLPLAGEGGMRMTEKDGGGRVGLPVEIVVAADLDPDNDGLTNMLEAFYGTDPHNPDTDGDGVSDGDEVNSGYNPGGSGRLFDFGLRFD